MTPPDAVPHADEAVIWKDNGRCRALAGDTEIDWEDFSNVFNEVVSALPRTGGSVTIRSGIYRITKTLIVDRPLTIRGVGAGNCSSVDNLTILVADDGMRDDILVVTGESAANDQMHGTYLGDLAVVGAGEEGSGDCIRICQSGDANVSDTYLERVFVDSAGRHGIHYDRANKHHQFKGVWAGHCQGDGIHLSDGHRYWLHQCYGYDSKTGIRITSSIQDVIVETVHCRKNEVTGIVVETDLFQILGGRYINNGEYGVDTRGAASGVVSGVEILNNGDTGAIVGSDAGDAGGVRLIGNKIGNRGDRPPRPAPRPDYDAVGGIRRFLELLAEDGVVTATREAQGYILDEVIQTKPEGPVEDGQKYGVHVIESASDTRLVHNNFRDNMEAKVRDCGTRTTVNGLGTSSGSPIVTAEWRDHAIRGTRVYDRVNDELFTAIDGDWYGPL